jgi:hypothetical protein
VCTSFVNYLKTTIFPTDRQHFDPLHEFSDYEEGDFQSDSKNFKVVSIGVILNIDDSILEFIDENPLCAYERNEDGFFVKIEDYDWDGYLNG